VIIVDANVLLHAVNRDAREHEVARAWLAGALVGVDAVAFAWTVILAFIRVSTHPSVLPRPLTPAEAIADLDAWLAAPSAIVVEPTPRHLPLLSGLLARSGTAGNLVSDAHLAVLALENDASIVSFDRDFGRFEGVRWRLPTTTER
jgi:toxin-antitoxin system PIN domain toxin